MKKSMTALAVFALAAFTLSSCKKDYTCRCTEPTGITNQDFQLENVSKDDAETACNTYNGAYVLVGGSCSLD
jgi:predicted small secreted protein